MSYKGLFHPKHPEKYNGTQPIVFRSTWEAALMKFLDEHSNVITWGSESIIIPYLSEIDGKYHRYYVDFNITFKNNETYLIEIKPRSQTVPPKKPKTGRTTRRYLRELCEYSKNNSKWLAAKKWAEEHGFKFNVWTEHELRSFGVKII